jgi:hypothetical protein
MNPALDRIALLASADLTAAEVALRGIPNDDPNGKFVPQVMALIRAGKYQLAEVMVEGARVGFTVYYVEEFGDHREFVSVATSCPKTNGLRFDLEKILLSFAQYARCKTLRMHTVRHGLVKQALDRDWHVAEIVLRKTV